MSQPQDIYFEETIKVNGKVHPISPLYILKKMNKGSTRT
jgi:hypothetical protein